MLLVTRAIIQTKAIPVVLQTPNRRGTGGSGKAIISRTSKKAFSSSSFSLLFTDQQRMMIFPPSLGTTTTHLALLTATASSSLFVSGFGVRHFHVHSLTLSSASAITTTTSRMMSGTTSNSNGKSKMDQSFKTWSFDEPCKTMAWSPLSDIELTATTATSAVTSSSSDDTDLIFVGVYAPKKQKEEDDDGKEKDDDDEEMEPYLSNTVQSLDSKLGGVLTELLLENNKEFKNGAKAGTTLPTVRISNSDGGKTQRYIVIGLGTETNDEIDDDKTTTVGNALGKALATHCDKEKKILSAKLVLPAVVKSSQQQQMFTDLSSTFYSTLYDDNRHRTKKSVKIAAKDVKTLSIETIGDEADDDAVLVSSWNDALLRGKKIAYGISMAKDVVNAPHNVLNSVSLADTAKRIADESTDGCLSCTILDKTECEKRGMGAYLGVARASETEPQFIHITYTPPSSSSTTASTTNKRVGIIGKGLLFDTGGYNIKTAGMELMKFDCGGAAAVLGAARAIGQLQPPGIECHFVVAACENMINEKGIVPSDILTASNGKTIEVLNTDAEGTLKYDRKRKTIRNAHHSIGTNKRHASLT